MRGVWKSNQQGSAKSQPTALGFSAHLGIYLDAVQTGTNAVTSLSLQNDGKHQPDLTGLGLLQLGFGVPFLKIVIP